MAPSSTIYLKHSEARGEEQPKGSPLGLLFRRLFGSRRNGAASAMESAATAGPASFSGASSPNGTKPRVLVVDDDPVILKTMGTKLARAGFEVLTSLDGPEAMGLVRTERPDVVVLDIFFPPDVAHGGGAGWDGFSIMQWLQRLEGNAGLPFIVITGSGDAEIHGQARELGACSVFQKPIDHNRLIASIHQALQARFACDPAKVAVPA
jgi:CheY-like chemotaxis protein